MTLIFRGMRASIRPGTGQAPSVSDGEAERQRVLNALAFHVSSLHPWGGVAAVGDTAYVVLPVSHRASDAESDSIRVAQAFLDRTSSQFTGRIGVSKVAATPADIVGARAEADRALRALNSEHALGVAGGISQLHVTALLLELRDLAQAHGYEPSGPIARLLDNDARRAQN